MLIKIHELLMDIKGINYEKVIVAYGIFNRFISF